MHFMLFWHTSRNLKSFIMQFRFNISEFNFVRQTRKCKKKGSGGTSNRFSLFPNDYSRGKFVRQKQIVKNIFSTIFFFFHLQSLCLEPFVSCFCDFKFIFFFIFCLVFVFKYMLGFKVS